MTRHTPRRLLSGIAAFAALAAGCGSDDEPTTAATTTIEAPDDSVAEEPVATTTTTEAPARGPLTDGELAAGSYETDQLATPLQFTVGDGMTTEFNEQGLVMVSGPDKVTQFTESVAFFRATGLANADQVVEIAGSSTYDGDPYDLEAWVDAAGEIVVADRSAMTINGVETTAMTLSVDPAGTAGRPNGCGPTADDRCFNVATTGALGIPSFIVRTTEVYRIWVFDQGDEVPVMAMAFAEAENASWLDEVADPIVQSVVLGDPQPAPEIESEEGVIDFAFQSIEAGSWTIRALGTEMMVELDDNWWVQPNDDTGFFVLTDPESMGPGDDDIVFVRVNAITDPDDPSAPADEQSGEWPLDDIEGWIAGLPETVLASNGQATEVGGHPAYRFDVELAPEHECGPDFCVGFVAHNPPSGTAFDHGFSYRVYWVDQSPYEPIAIVLGTADADSGWFDTAEATLATLQIGEPAPHPLPEGNLWEFGIDAEIPAGPAMIPALGGLGFELSTPAFLAQPPNAAIFFLDGPGEVNIIKPFADRDGNMVDSADAFTAVLDDLGVTWNTDEPRTVLGVEAATVVITDAPPPDFSQPGPPITTDEEGFGGWGPPNQGRFYLADTERGFLLLGAESYEDSSMLDTAIALQEELLSALEFIDFTG